MRNVELRSAETPGGGGGGTWDVPRQYGVRAWVATWNAESSKTHCCSSSSRVWPARPASAHGTGAPDVATSDDDTFCDAYRNHPSAARLPFSHRTPFPFRDRGRWRREPPPNVRRWSKRSTDRGRGLDAPTETSLGRTTTSSPSCRSREKRSILGHAGAGQGLAHALQLPCIAPPLPNGDGRSACGRSFQWCSGHGAPSSPTLWRASGSRVHRSRLPLPIVLGRGPRRRRTARKDGRALVVGGGRRIDAWVWTIEDRPTPRRRAESVSPPPRPWCSPSLALRCVSRACDRSEHFHRRHVHPPRNGRRERPPLRVRARARSRQAGSRDVRRGVVSSAAAFARC